VLVTHDISEAITMGDRVLVLTRRPARVQAEHIIRFAGPGRPTPLEVRSLPEHNAYFQAIWKELEDREES